MSILWCGGEDIDFPNGGNVSTDVTAARFRSGYARCGVQASGNQQYRSSLAFAGGAVTSTWFSFTLAYNSASTLSQLLIGLIDSANAPKGVWIGCSATAFHALRAALYKFDGTTKTMLAEGNGDIWVGGIYTPMRFDLQLVSYGASATLNLFINGTLLVTYSGDVTVSGVTGVSAVGISSGGNGSVLSEIIVADEDTRAFPGLATLALTGAGTTDQWTGIFSDVNGTSFSDATPNFTNTNAQDQQYNWTDLPAGTFAIKAVKIAARMAKSASPAVTQVKLGYKSGGSTGFGTGATKALTTAYATYEQIDSTNPVTAAAWVQSDMNALQVDAQSLT